MATVIRETTVDATAARCWDALRDFGALHERLVTGFVTDAVMTGPGERQVTFFTGAVARERLVGIDEEAMRLAYTVVEGPMSSTHHSASAQIVPAGPGQCRIVWITDVLPDELADRTASLMEAGLKAMKSTLEGAAAAERSASYRQNQRPDPVTTPVRSAAGRRAARRPVLRPSSGWCQPATS